MKQLAPGDSSTLETTLEIVIRFPRGNLELVSMLSPSAGLSSPGIL